MSEEKWIFLILDQQMTDQKTLFARGAAPLVIFGTSDKILRFRTFILFVLVLKILSGA